MIVKTELSCMLCGRVPEEIEPYIDATIVGMAESPSEWVLRHESTLNAKTGRFVCPRCWAQAVSALHVYETLHCHCAGCESARKLESYE